jgi:hypothetical protein
MQEIDFSFKKKRKIKVSDPQTPVSDCIVRDYKSHTRAFRERKKKSH